MAESNVAIVPDSVVAGAHNIRTVTVQVDNSNVVAGGQSEQQEVTALAGSDGSLLNLTHGALPVASEELALLLKAMLVRLDLLCHMIDRSYKSPDKLGL